jgi:Zn-dependent metalloprotease
MKRLLVCLMMILISGILFGNQAKIYERAEMKTVSGIPVVVNNIQIPVKTDVPSLKRFIKNDFYKNFNIGQNVEPELLRAVNFDGTSIYKFALFYKGIPVEGTYTVLSIKNGKIQRISNSIGNINIDTSKLISSDVAVKAAMKVRKIKNFPSKFHAEKLIYPYFGSFVPVYKVRFAPIHLADNRFHIVEARTGKVIQSGNSTWFEDDPEPTDKALMWKYNPVITPDLEEVDLVWVAPHDDADVEVPGSLITLKDDEGVRAIKAFNCPNEGDKIDLQELIGMSVLVPMCTPTPLANKIDNGSFMYEDCESGHEFDEDHILKDDINRCAEISMYYHSAKIYEYLRSLYSEIGTDDEFYLQNNDAERPLNVIGNFTTPELSVEAIMGGSEALVPFDNAFFSQDNPMIGDLLGQFGVKGDLLVFGLGTKANFAYDGDVVYHEFGHATIYTTGIVGMEYADKYGITNQPGGLHEGLADTFAFLMTDNSCTGEYASEGFIKYAQSQGGIIEMDKEGDYYCMRTALNEYIVFEDTIGQVHWDGQPTLAANWEIYKLLKKDMSVEEARDNLTKLVMKTLYTIGTSNASFKLYAETMMDEVEKDSVFKTYKDKINTILDERNFFEEIRARSANKTVKESYVPGVAGDDDMMGGGGGGSGIEIVEEDETIAIAPSYMQFYYDFPDDADKNGIQISASVSSDQGGGMMPGGGGTPSLEIYYRKGAPIEYVLDEDSLEITALKDGKVETEDTGLSRKWKIPDLEKGEKYYFQFINTGAAGILKNITVTPADVEIVEEEEDDADEEEEDKDPSEDDQLPEEESKDTNKSSKGCSILFF